MNKALHTDEHIEVKVVKSQTRFVRVKNPKGADTGIGHYFLMLEITALGSEVYMPISISSGKKVTGFMYYIEGTATGSLSTAEVEARGEGVTKVTIGTLQYAKIPKGKIGLFRIQIEIQGKVGKEYSVHIHQINYKQSPKDARYKKFTHTISSPILKFK